MQNRCIELHDSELEGIAFEGRDAVLHFPHVYIHASEGRPAWDRGTGWSQEAFLRIGVAHVDGKFSEESRAAYDGVHCLSTGDLTINGNRSHNSIPIPLNVRGSVELTLECWGDTVRVSGDSITLELIGEARYVEEFPGSEG
jgi:hypothetical protein